MRVIFWGTRGSLPTPLSASGVRSKLIAALVKGARRGLDTPEKAAAFCERELSFAESATFGGNTSCVQIDTGGPEYLLCDLGSGAREFAVRAVARHGPASPQTYHILVSHVHWDHIMGFPFFVPVYHAGQPDPDLQLPCRARGGVPPPERRAQLPGRVRLARRRDRVRPARARPPLRRSPARR